MSAISSSISLIGRLKSFDTIRDMESALEDRYFDALCCVLDEPSDRKRFFGGCYLLGYVMEISLKVAFFRFGGIGVIDDLTMPRASLGGMIRKNQNAGLHDLVALVTTLIAERAARGNPYDRQFATDLTAFVTKAAKHWKVEMRYQEAVPAVNEFHELLDSVDWVMNNRQRLWR
jgi:hypothetical protein